MKNDLHLAYKTIFNHPLHISSPDSVRAHLADEVRLLTQLPGEWPKVRGRFFTDRKNYRVENTFKIRDLTAESVVVFTGDSELRGKLVAGKYFFSDGILNNSVDMELFFTPFEEMGAKTGCPSLVVTGLLRLVPVFLYPGNTRNEELFRYGIVYRN